MCGSAVIERSFRCKRLYATHFENYRPTFRESCLTFENFFGYVLECTLGHICQCILLKSYDNLSIPLHQAIIFPARFVHCRTCTPQPTDANFGTVYIII